jgi:CDP-diacylglycerol---serine O-phosphatidyltransferase
MTEPDPKREIFESTRASRIYFLPNLMTAGNLFCGFVAVIMCIQARSASVHGFPELSIQLYTYAVWLILAAVIFDALDGRLARLGGRESLFGKEFDSLADVISFGMAPALMVFFLILSPTQDYPFFRRIGWFIGFLYLLCAAVRLARFNVITHPAVYSLKPDTSSKDFVGLPVPAAAGSIASLVLVLNAYDIQRWAILLPILMILIAYLMVSAIRYPSFKAIDWKTQVRFRTFILLFAAGVLLWQVREIGLALVFLGYIGYGITMHMRKVSRQSLRLKELREKRLGVLKKRKEPVNKPE